MCGGYGLLMLATFLFDKLENKRDIEVGTCSLIWS